MNKTFTMNLSGLIFHIDEDAFGRLQDYIQKLKQHFANQAGSEEIIADIESRMAELLQERLGDHKQVVGMADVDHIITQLGQPFEMETDETGEPKQQATYSYGRKRLFRDPDNRKIAGVSAGIAAYLSIDAIWIRLLFILSLLASGAGLLIYIVLWIVLPEANTTAEKLEMKGEAVNISNMEKAMRKEVNEMADKFNTYAKGAHESFKKKVPETRNFFDRMITALGYVLRAIFKVAGVFIGFVLLFTGLGLITGFFAGFVGLEGLGFLWESEGFQFSPLLMGDLFFQSKAFSSLAILSFSLIVILPVVLLIYGGLRLLSAGRFRIRHLTLVSVVVWFASWVVLLGIGIGTAFDFGHTGQYESHLKTIEPATEKPFVIGLKSEVASINQFESMMIDYSRLMFFDLYENKIFQFPQLRVIPSDDALIHLRLVEESCGRSLSKAEIRAQNIDYAVSISDSSLHLPLLFSYPASDLIRGQEAKLYIEIPVGKKVYFEESVYSNNLPNEVNYRFLRRYAGKNYVMTKGGLVIIE